MFGPGTSARQKDDCCDFIAALGSVKTETSLSGSFSVGYKDERHRVSNHSVWM
jgi:hypothetical protein